MLKQGKLASYIVSKVKSFVSKTELVPIGLNITKTVKMYVFEQKSQFYNKKNNFFGIKF
jgi:hypothetical protein